MRTSVWAEAMKLKIKEMCRRNSLQHPWRTHAKGRMWNLLLFLGFESTGLPGIPPAVPQTSDACS